MSEQSHSEDVSSVAEHVTESAEQWLREYYAYDDSAFSHDALEHFSARRREFYALRDCDEAEVAAWRKRMTLEDKNFEYFSLQVREMREAEEEFTLIAQHPELTEEELRRQNHGAHGTTNNFWRRFFPDEMPALRNGLAHGNFPRERDLYHWLRSGLLMDAFKEVGYDRIREMHRSIAEFLRLDEEWKQRIGDDPMGLWYGVGFIPNSPLITSKERESYTKHCVQFKSTLRVLVVALHRRGVPFRIMKR